MSAKPILLTVVIAAAGWWAYTALFPSPEKQIPETLERLATTASFSSNEKPLARLGAMNAVPAFFHSNAVLRVSSQFYSGSLEGRAEIREAIAGSRAGARSLDIRLTDPQITLNSATEAELVVTATAILDADPNPSLQILQMRMLRTGRRWLIRSVEPIQLNEL